MDILNLLSYLICDNKASVKQNALNEGKKLFDGVDENILSDDFDEFMCVFKRDVKPALFEFWSYTARFGTDLMLDYTSFQQVIVS